MDLLTALPFELSMKVLKYLTPIETIKLRAVSKSYYDLLTSEEICSFLSHQFITPENSSTKTPSSWRLYYENRISRRLSFASGDPWQVEFLDSINYIQPIVFCPETLCLTLPNYACDSVSVLDLNSYPAKCVFPPTRTPERSRIAHVSLLPSFVVVVTQMGHGYAWNLKTHKEHQLKLPETPIMRMRGSGNLVVITLEGWVVVHDVQAQETSTFKDTRKGVRMWEGGEMEVDLQQTCIVINPEKQVLWMICKASARGHGLLVIDSLHLETGGFVQSGISEFPQRSIPDYSRHGLWRFLEHTGETAKRAIFDQATGRLTVEYFPVKYPAHRSVSRVWGPTVSSGGLGCFIDGVSPNRVWMLNQEPGDEVTHARSLDLYTPGRVLECIYFCDKLALFCTASELIVARFAGIHDNHDE